MEQLSPPPKPAVKDATPAVQRSHVKSKLLYVVRIGRSSGCRGRAHKTRWLATLVRILPVLAE